MVSVPFCHVFDWPPLPIFWPLSTCKCSRSQRLGGYTHCFFSLLMILYPLLLTQSIPFPMTLTFLTRSLPRKHWRLWCWVIITSAGPDHEHISWYFHDHVPCYASRTHNHSISLEQHRFSSYLSVVSTEVGFTEFTSFPYIYKLFIFLYSYLFPSCAPCEADFLIDNGSFFTPPYLLLYEARTPPPYMNTAIVFYFPSWTVSAKAVRLTDNQSLTSNL